MLETPMQRTTRSTCLDSTLAFETSALERIVREPGKVLEDEDRFWEEEPAQKYTSVWAEKNGFIINRRKWRGRLTRFAELSEADRLDSRLMRTTEAILSGRRRSWRGPCPTSAPSCPQAPTPGCRSTSPPSFRLGPSSPAAS